MDISVIVPAHNEERHLPEQLDALLSQKWSGEWEILVVDNRSSDGTAALVHEYSRRDPRVNLVEAHERADKSYAMNLAVEHANAEAIVFCDADDRVAAGWLESMAEGLVQHEVVTGPNEVDELNPPWLAASRGRSIEEPSGTYFGLFPCIRGNNFGVTKRSWSIVGGMTEDFPAGEDTEFSLRCWLSDVQIVGLPGSIVHYRYRSSARVLWKQGFAYGAHRPRIARVLKDAGKATPTKFAGWKSWILLIAKTPTLVTRSGRATWMWIAGNRLGQIAGCLRYRIVML